MNNLSFHPLQVRAYHRQNKAKGNRQQQPHYPGICYEPEEPRSRRSPSGHSSGSHRATTTANNIKNPQGTSLRCSVATLKAQPWQIG